MLVMKTIPIIWNSPEKVLVNWNVQKPRNGMATEQMHSEINGTISKCIRKSIARSWAAAVTNQTQKVKYRL